MSDYEVCVECGGQLSDPPLYLMDKDDTIIDGPFCEDCHEAAMIEEWEKEEEENET